MEIDQVIRERRSIRRYRDKGLSWQQIGLVLDAGRYAPSAGNVQNWRFVVVRDKKRKNEIATACARQYWMNEAPVLIIICDDLTNIKTLYGKRGENLYSIQDCAAACENIILKATSMNLGTCWIGAMDEDAICRILKLPSNIKPEIILTLGYPDEKPGPEMKYPLSKITFYEEYGKKEIEKEFDFFPLEKQAEKAEESFEKSKSKVKRLFKRFKKS